MVRTNFYTDSADWAAADLHKMISHISVTCICIKHFAPLGALLPFNALNSSCGAGFYTYMVFVAPHTQGYESERPWLPAFWDCRTGRSYYGATEQGSKRGRGTSKMNIMVAISKDAKGRPQYLKMQVIDNLKGETIGTFAKANIAQGSTIQSDAYRSYRKPLAEDYSHQHDIFNSDSDMLHWLHVVVGNAKAFLLGTYHGNCRDNLQSFLDEFCYRFNRRGFKDELFSRLLHAVTQSYILGSAVLSR